MSDNKVASAEPTMDEILASIRRILAEDEPVVARSAPAPAPRLRADNDVLDLTEALNEDGTVRHIAPIAIVAPEPTARAVPERRIEPARPTAAAAEPRLVSAAASDAVAASFARLASLPREADGEPVLDGLVREALRPLLQAWLDQHLPALVERLVKAEIGRVVGSRPLAP